MGVIDRTVGYREHVALPDLGVELVAKVDTGARSSSVHAEGIVVRDTPAGRRVRATIPLDRLGERRVDLDAPLLGWRWVRDSGGHGSLRPVVSTTVALGPWSWTEELTLADRPGMRHRMLLGRVAVRGRFLVDPARSFLVGQPSPLCVADGPSVPGPVVPVAVDGSGAGPVSA